MRAHTGTTLTNLIQDAATHNQASSSILCAITPERRIRQSNTITHIARHFTYVHNSAKLLDVADALQPYPNIPAVAVIDQQGHVEGIIEREKLFSLIGKPFGREVLRRNLITEHVLHAVCIDYRMDIFAAADMVQNADTAESEYFVLVDEASSFRGIFSRHDLNENLADIIKNDIILAGKLQERLLSYNELNEDHYSVKAWSRSAKGIGGDFFHIQKTLAGQLLLAVCDVSGKGVSASFVVAMVAGMLRSVDPLKGLKAIVSDINTAVITAFHLEKYLTGLFLQYSPDTRALLFADMGHSHALVLRNNRCIPLKSQILNLPIGLDIALTPAISGVRLMSGDRLFVYTDGITEQENQQGTEFGQTRLESALLASLVSGQNPIDAVQASIDLFRGANPQQDDMTCLLLAIH